MESTHGIDESYCKECFWADIIEMNLPDFLYCIKSSQYISRLLYGNCSVSNELLYIYIKDNQINNKFLISSLTLDVRTVPDIRLD
jgi:hypothetical protein